MKKYITLVDAEYRNNKKKDVLYFLVQDINDFVTDIGDNSNFYTTMPMRDEDGVYYVGGTVRICRKENEKRIKEEMLRKYAREIKKEKESVSRKIWRIHRMLDKENCSLNFTL